MLRSTQLSVQLGYVYRHITWIPFVIPYYILWILLHVFMRKRSNSLLHSLGWSTDYGWLKWLGLQPVWIYKFTVAAIRRTVKRKFFRYEPAVSDFIKKIHGDLFIDVGAGLGFYSFLLYYNFKGIIAFEPHPMNIAVINEVKQLDRYSNIKVLRMAVGDKNGQSRLFIGKHIGQHSLLDHTRSKEGSFIVVPITTLTTFLSNKIQSRNVDLVKVDVEGAEQMVLKGAEFVMQKIKSWIIEVHGTNNRLIEMKNLLHSYGYKTRWLDGRHIYAWRV